GEGSGLSPAALLALFNFFRKIFFIHRRVLFNKPGSIIQASPAKSNAATARSAARRRSGIKIYSGKNAIGGRSATSEIALQSKGVGGQRGVARFNVMVVDPSCEFSGCYCHCSLALRLNISEAGFYTSPRRGSSRISHAILVKVYSDLS